MSIELHYNNYLIPVFYIKYSKWFKYSSKYSKIDFFFSYFHRISIYSVIYNREICIDVYKVEYKSLSKNIYFMYNSI